MIAATDINLDVAAVITSVSVLLGGVAAIYMQLRALKRENTAQHDAGQSRVVDVQEKLDTLIENMGYHKGRAEERHGNVIKELDSIATNVVAVKKDVGEVKEDIVNLKSRVLKLEAEDIPT